MPLRTIAKAAVPGSNNNSLLSRMVMRCMGVMVLMPRHMLAMMPSAMQWELTVLELMMAMISVCCWPGDLWAVSMACMVTVDADLVASRHRTEGLANCLELREWVSTSVMALLVIAALAMALENSLNLSSCLRALRERALLMACMVMATPLVAIPDWLRSVALLA
jgi:hypothetical protein